MEQIQLREYGLTEAMVAEIHARDQRQFRLFVTVTAWGCGLLWLVLTILIYSKSVRSDPILGLVVSPLLALLGAGIGTLPIMIASAILSFVLCPRHAKAEALKKYEAAASRIRVCDVCALALGDHSQKRDVAYCGMCDARPCPDCRRRYDLRAIAALKRKVGGSTDQKGVRGDGFA